MFLKTHKCASSTVQNIILRYGYNNNLTFALPPRGHYLGHPQLFRARMLAGSLMPKSRKVDLFVLHSRLNPPQNSAILHNDTLWVTIVREPASLYESLFSYYGLDKTYGFNLSEFSHKPLKELLALGRHKKRHGRNQMLFDLGYPSSLSDEELRRAIEDLDRRFHLVMISERMDESLVLLRHLLCWTPRDVVGFTRNARRQDVKTEQDPQTLKTLRELNSADVALYNHFLRRHQGAVKKFGKQKMADEVAELQRLRGEYFKNCGIKEVSGKDESLKDKEFSDLVGTYLADKNSGIDCQMMSMPEPSLVKMVRRHQKVLLRVLE